TLDKGYGATDWSRFPLSKAQLAYAALDVESLLELADEMSYELEQDHKTRWALEEFRVIREQFADITAPAPRHWHQSRSLRGLSDPMRSEEHTSELQSRFDHVCLLLLYNI